MKKYYGEDLVDFAKKELETIGYTKAVLRGRSQYCKRARKEYEDILKTIQFFVDLKSDQPSASALALSRLFLKEPLANRISTKKVEDWETTAFADVRVHRRADNVVWQKGRALVNFLGYVFVRGSQEKVEPYSSSRFYMPEKPIEVKNLRPRYIDARLEALVYVFEQCKRGLYNLRYLVKRVFGKTGLR
jgi:hypothetical protein